MKKYGYFGNGLEGYMHYKLAFDRSFADEDKGEYSSFNDFKSDDEDDYDFDTDYEDDDE